MFEHSFKAGAMALVAASATLVYGWLAHRHGWPLLLAAPFLVFAGLTGALAVEWWDARRYRR